jgi:hypothetical protein
MAGFAQALRAQGVAEEEISRQAGLFMHAVQMQLQSVCIDDGTNAVAG